MPSKVYTNYIPAPYFLSFNFQATQVFAFGVCLNHSTARFREARAGIHDLGIVTITADLNSDQFITISRLREITCLGF